MLNLQGSTSWILGMLWGASRLVAYSEIACEWTLKSVWHPLLAHCRKELLWL